MFNKKISFKFTLIFVALFTALLSGATFSYAAVANSPKELQAIFQKEFENRNRKFSVTYNGQVNSFRDLVRDNYQIAANSTYYTKYSILGYKARGSYTGSSAEIEMEVNYVSTAEQEQMVETRTDEVIKKIIKPGMSEAEKVGVINNYIVDLVEYDYKLEKRSAYTALFDKLSVCQGYSLLSDKLFTKAKVESLIVEGTLKGGGHVWNKVKIDGVWYNFDVTNNDTNNNKYYGVTDNFLRSNEFAFQVTNYPNSDKMLNSALKKPVKKTVKKPVKKTTKKTVKR